jgi:MoaA/NifB/PqqE/SkfB family radical SAM enzyme
MFEKDLETIDLELTSRCNLKCVMCPHAFPEYKASHDKELSLEDLKRLAPVLRRTKIVTLHGVGEPLLYSHLPEAFDFLGGLGCKIAFISNGLLWHARNRELIRQYASIISWIHVSLDAATAPTYKKIRGASFEKVIGNLNAFMAERAGDSPKLYINMTVMKENIRELVPFVELAATLDKKIGIWPLADDGVYGGDHWKVQRDGWLFNYNDQVVNLTSPEYATIMDSARRRAKEMGVEFGFDFNRSYEPKPISDCNLPFEHFEILVNGEVRHCCHQPLPLFSWREAGVEAFVDSPTHKNVQRLVKAGKIPATCGGARCDFVCRKKADEEVTTDYPGRFYVNG